MIKHICCYLLLLLVLSCQTFKPVGLYEVAAPVSTAKGINNFYSLKIFSDQITNDLWFSPEVVCLQVAGENIEKKEGEGAISIEWNKQAGNCTWIGMGIGWDNWTGKDMSSVLHSSALSLWAKMKKGQSSGLPWAVGFEDFSGNQAWTGVTSGCVVGGVVKDTWTQIIIPLENFPFENRDVDMTAIKQVIFQFESSGKVWVDEISIVPYTPKAKMQTSLRPQSIPTIDGSILPNEWSSERISVGNARITFGCDEKNLYLSGMVEDASPLINPNFEKDVWNGDAIEISFSSLSSSDPKRKIFYASDHHIGLSMSKKPFCYDWTQGKNISGAIVKTKSESNQYYFEAAIPWSELGAEPWKSGNTYGLEVALDMSDDTGIRKEQIRWNSSTVEGFNFNPSLWGSIRIEPQ
jgi:hypothetical protein